jgi:hypothetical protein
MPCKTVLHFLHTDLHAWVWPVLCVVWRGHMYCSIGYVMSISKTDGLTHICLIISLSCGELSHISTLGGCECWAYAPNTSRPVKQPSLLFEQRWGGCADSLYTALSSSRIVPSFLHNPAYGSLVTVLICRYVCTWLLKTLQQFLPIKRHDLILCHLQVETKASCGVLEQVDWPDFLLYCVCCYAQEQFISEPTIKYMCMNITDLFRLIWLISAAFMKLEITGFAKQILPVWLNCELCLLSTDCKVLLPATCSCHSRLSFTMLPCFNVDILWPEML